MSAAHGHPDRARSKGGRFVRAYVPLTLLGCASLLGVVPLLAPAVESLRLRPEFASLPDAGLYAVLLAQPAILLLVLTALGLALADKAGLRSLVADAARGRPLQPAPARATGRLAAVTVVAAVLVLVVDAALARAYPHAFASVPPASAVPPLARLGALLYGAVAEELMLRLGVMTVLVALGRRLFAAAFARNPGFVVWPAIAASAVLFGVLHLPALAGVAPLTVPLVVRTIMLNAALGLLFGFAYWRYALEYAMFSHALVHVVFGVAGAVTAGAAPTLLGP